MSQPECKIEIDVNYGQCYSTSLDISDREEYASIAALIRQMKENAKNRGDCPASFDWRIYISKELKEASFSMHDNIVVDGMALWVCVVPFIPNHWTEDGLLHTEIFIGNYEDYL